MEKTLIFLVSDSINAKHKNFLGYFLHGLKQNLMNLKNIKQKKIQKITLNIAGNKNKPSSLIQLKFKALEEELFLPEI